MLAPVIGAAANATLIDCDELAPADLTPSCWIARVVV
jgi:hypothetical protein